jgi:hypothetical protein
MGRHDTREDEVDRMLPAKLFAPCVVERSVLGKALAGECPFFDLGHDVDRPPG